MPVDERIRTIQAQLAALNALSNSRMQRDEEDEGGHAARAAVAAAATAAAASATLPPSDYVEHEILRMNTYLKILRYPSGEYTTGTPYIEQRVTPTPPPAPTRRLSLKPVVDNDGHGGDGDLSDSDRSTNSEYRDVDESRMKASLNSNGINVFGSLSSADPGFASSALSSAAERSFGSNQMRNPDAGYRIKSGAQMTRTKSTVIRLPNQPSSSSLATSRSAPAAGGFALTFPSSPKRRGFSRNGIDNAVHQILPNARIIDPGASEPMRGAAVAEVQGPLPAAIKLPATTMTSWV